MPLKFTPIQNKIIGILEQKDNCSISEIASFLGRPFSTVYHCVIVMENLGLVKTERVGKKRMVKISNPKSESSEEGESALKKAIQRFGLTDIDLVILKAEGENLADIAEQTGLLLNVIDLHISNILIRIKVETLIDARKIFFQQVPVSAS